jgi:hypothetical protein
VEKSALSHFDRSDIEQVFELQPRAANKLLAMLPKGVGPGRSILVERNTLLSFLEEVQRTGKLESARTKVSRRKMRMRPRPEGLEVGSVAKLPGSVKLAPGLIQITYTTAEERTYAMWAIAMADRDDGEAFDQVSLPARPVDPERAAEIEDARAIREESRRLDEAIAAKKRPGVVVSIAASEETA